MKASSHFSHNNLTQHDNIHTIQQSSGVYNLSCRYQGLTLSSHQQQRNMLNQELAGIQENVKPRDIKNLNRNNNKTTELPTLKSKTKSNGWGTRELSGKVSIVCLYSKHKS